MLYVQQSLSPNEEILMGARFHWMYTATAVGWILFGLALSIGVGYGAIWVEISSIIRDNYPEIPQELYAKAWDQVVAQKGGYLQILWKMHVSIRIGILAFFVLGLYFFAHKMVVKATTEIAVTTERLVYKKGLIARHVGEINIDRIEGVSVRQGAVARIFGYGIVCIRGMGVGEVMLPPIENPIEFRKAVNEAKAMRDKSGNLKTDDFG